jgi:CheY-like chemotaxis protein
MDKKRPRILVADDDPGILEVISLMLRDAGYDVKTTANGKSLLNIHGNLPQMVLLDIWMSGINGSEICRKLKTQEKTTNIPVILISANKDTEHLAKRSGADDFISKPFDMDTLLDKVKRHISI